MGLKQTEQTYQRLYRDINEFKKGYLPRTNLIKDENNLFADSHGILSKRKNYFCQVLNAHGINVRQTEMHTAETLVPEPSPFEGEIAIEKLKRYRSPGTDHISTELIQAGSNKYILRSTDLLFVFGIRKKCHSSGRILSLYLFIKRVMKLTEEYCCYQVHTKVYPIFWSQG
jgi:hypothetical protein